MSAAAEVEFARHLRTFVAASLPPAAAAGIDWRVITRAAQPALTRGWPPDALARQAVLGAATAGNPGGLLVANLRQLATTTPPPAPAAAAPRSDRLAVVTSPQPLPECARCGQPHRPGAQHQMCGGCGQVLRLVQFDPQAQTVRAS